MKKVNEILKFQNYLKICSVGGWAGLNTYFVVL